MVSTEPVETNRFVARLMALHLTGRAISYYGSRRVAHWHRAVGMCSDRRTSGGPLPRWPCPDDHVHARHAVRVRIPCAGEARSRSARDC